MTHSITQKSVSLVLGSGGARGLAHIGVIQWLDQNNFKIESIAGSSIGALIGGIYAAGKLDVYAKWVSALEKKDVIRLLDISFARKSLFKGDRIIEVLREMIGDYEIENLPVSYTAIATDMRAQREVWLNHGSLFDAIRASIAIPTIFSPYEYQGKVFLDGSLVNPIPIAPTLNDKTDLTIVVNLNGKVISPTKTHAHPRKEESVAPKTGNNLRNYHQGIVNFINNLSANGKQPSANNHSLIEIIAKSMDTMQSKLASYQLAACTPDAIVSIPINICSFYEFYRAKELIEIGYQSAKTQLFLT